MTPAMFSATFAPVTSTATPLETHVNALRAVMASFNHGPLDNC
jgi:hypothetical protein